VLSGLFNYLAISRRGRAKIFGKRGCVSVNPAGVSGGVLYAIRPVFVFVLPFGGKFLLFPLGRVFSRVWGVAEDLLRAKGPPQVFREFCDGYRLFENES
jgi:hypothetical protein